MGRALTETDGLGQTVTTQYDPAGSQELAEIQMPGSDTVSVSTLENDVQPLGSRAGFVNGIWVDQTPFFGRVAYTHALGIDRPLSLARYNYADSLFNRPLMQWEPFSLVPHWNVRGEADNGSFADGGLTKCTTDGAGQRCVQAAWPFGWTATAQRAHDRRMWHRPLVEDKRDGSGLLFRRNRYVDPANGRFTQEDPIGLAGGLNLYGFAGGDPVNFSDPFGLCPEFITGRPCSDAVAIGVGFIPIVGDAIDIAGAVVGTDLMTGEDIGAVGVGVTIAGTFFGSGKLAREGAKHAAPALIKIKSALGAVHGEVGKLPKGKPGKFGSPQRGTTKKGYRLDPPHPHAKPGSPEEGWHINWWDWAEGKRGSGGRSGGVRIEP